MHDELLHHDLDLELGLVLQLRQVDEFVMAHHLVLVMRKGEEGLRFVVTEGRVH
jgi:hypothetical protein